MKNTNSDVVEYEGIVKHLVEYSKGKLKWKLESLPEDILQSTVEDLEKNQKITDTDRKLRLQLHREFAQASVEGRVVRIDKVCAGICHSNHFLKLIEKPEKLGWLALPYQHEYLRLEHQVVRAQDAVEELLRVPIHNKDGSLNIKAAELKFKAAKLIYDRKYPSTTKMEYVNEKQVDNTPTIDIEAKIEALEKELKKNGSK